MTSSGRRTGRVEFDKDVMIAVVPASWSDIAERVTAAFELKRGSLVVLRDRAGRSDVLESIVIAFEQRGITTVIDACSDAVLDAVLSTDDPSLLDTWGRHRAAILELADAVVSLAGAPVPTANASVETLAALRAGRAVMEEVEARRRIPYLSVAIATPRLAQDLGRTVEALDGAVRDALAVPLNATRSLIDAHLARAAGDPITVVTPGCELTLRRGTRPWLDDDGHISSDDRSRGAVASTLPCGAIYTTVIEDSVDGTVRVGDLADGHDLVLTYSAGRLVDVSGHGADSVLPWFASFGADSARISHVGIGLNPACTDPTGWVIVDEHRAGAVLLAFGENRYLGGRNASTLNHDVVLPTPSFRAGDTTLVDRGELTLPSAG